MRVWQESSNLAVLIICTFEDCKNWPLRDQIIRSSLSVSANIAEGFGRFTSKDFLRFLSYALGSCFETQSHLYIAFRLWYLQRSVYEEFDKKFFEITKMINSLASRERSQPKKFTTSSKNR